MQWTSDPAVLDGFAVGLGVAALGVTVMAWLNIAWGRLRGDPSWIRGFPHLRGKARALCLLCWLTIPWNVFSVFVVGYAGETFTRKPGGETAFVWIEFVAVPMVLTTATLVVGASNLLASVAPETPYGDEGGL